MLIESVVARMLPGLAEEETNIGELLVGPDVADESNEVVRIFVVLNEAVAFV